MAAQQRKIGLGRGLGALLQDEDINRGQSTAKASADAATKQPDSKPVGGINFIEVHQVSVNPFQPRTE
ncbi:hypothetical protein M8994_21630, partial [Brucella sp. 21LCYQ03]|nr:hypothetical protein [Brucella sp. 21LCYQ03]